MVGTSQAEPASGRPRNPHACLRLRLCPHSSLGLWVHLSASVLGNDIMAGNVECMACGQGTVRGNSGRQGFGLQLDLGSACGTWLDSCSTGSRAIPAAVPVGRMAAPYAVSSRL